VIKYKLNEYKSIRTVVLFIQARQNLLETSKLNAPCTITKFTRVIAKNRQQKARRLNLRFL